MRADVRRFLIRGSFAFCATWVVSVGLLFGIYFALRAAFAYWR